jgi:DNA-directed RNA polymerase specialized sigma24 family protein
MGGMEAHEQEILKFIEQGQQGIKAAVERLMERYDQPLYDFCIRTLTREALEAQKITAQTFLQLPSRLLTYQEGSLFVLLKQVAYELYVAQNPSKRFEEWDADEEEQAARDALSDSDRILLHLMDNETWREIARLLRIPESTARKRGQRARERLAEIKHVRRKT